jgi:hypothetical protein
MRRRDEAQDGHALARDVRDLFARAGRRSSWIPIGVGFRVLTS